MLALWDGGAQAVHNGIRQAEITFVCGWRCADAVRAENPGWLFRSLTFGDFLQMLGAHIQPSVAPDPVAEVKIRLELVLSASPNEWVDAKRLHARLPGQVRSSGAWEAALADLIADGRLEMRRVRTNPKARPKTVYKYLPAEPTRN